MIAARVGTALLKRCSSTGFFLCMLLKFQLFCRIPVNACYYNFCVSLDKLNKVFIQIAERSNMRLFMNFQKKQNALCKDCYLVLSKTIYTLQKKKKKKFPTKDFFSKCDQIHRKLFCSVTTISYHIFAEIFFRHCSETVALRYSLKRLPLACNYLQIPAQIFSCEFCETFQIIFLSKHLRKTASDFFRQCSDSVNNLAQ